MRWTILAPLAVALSSTTAPVHAHPHGHHSPAAETGVHCAKDAPVSVACAKSVTPVFDANGTLWITWQDRGHVYVQHSSNDGRSFSDPVAVNAEPEPVDDRGEDRPRIAVGPDGEIYVLWTRKLDKPYTGHIRFSRSLDNGETFSPPVNVNDDDAVIAHRFANFAVNDKGAVFVAWIDKRNVAAAEAAGREYAGAALYYAVSEDRGASFSASRKLADHSCECCRIAMGLDAKGLPVLFYRHVFPGQVRDHAILRFKDVNTPLDHVRATFDDWEINGCPHQGPALAISDGVLHMAWFTAGPERQGLFYARREDGKTSEPMQLGRRGAEHAAVKVIGDDVVLAWKNFVDNETQVSVQRSTDGGLTWQPPVVMARTSGASDHPQLVSNGEQAYLSWQTAMEGYRLVPLAGAER